MYEWISLGNVNCEFGLAEIKNVIIYRKIELLNLKKRTFIKNMGELFPNLLTARGKYDLICIS